VAEQKGVVQQQEEKLNIEARMTADRVREVTLIEADMNAKKEQVQKVVAAEAQRESERHLAEAEKIRTVTTAEASRDAGVREAERMQILADAEARASEKRRIAMEQQAEGVSAQEAARGLAEAKVMIAKAGARQAEAEAVKQVGLAEAEVTKAKGTVNADMTQSQAHAEAQGTKDKELAAAAGIEARGQAEAKSIEEKARAMKLLHEAGQQHEEFRLRLAKERDVELAAIHVDKDIAEANARIVGEALKVARIDIVGGSNDFFEKVVRAVGSGKAVDRLVSNSTTLTDIKETFFDGDPERFKTQVRQWIADFGIPTEDLKNLTLSALFAKLLAGSGDDAVKSALQAAVKTVHGAGLGDTPAGRFLNDSKTARV
jgi:hypothetical protein